jgi:hypothetical protein
LNDRLDSLGAGGKTDIDTLTFVSLVEYCIISIEQKHRVVAESCREEPMYRSFELIYEALNQISWCYDVFCLYMVNGMLTVVLFSLLCICLILCVCRISC